jgi:hypothetical protein
MTVNDKRRVVETPTSSNESTRTFIHVAKAIQFLFLAIFAFGVAWSISDLAGAFEIPITAWALGCTIFGAEGVLASEYLVRKLEKEIRWD